LLKSDPAQLFEKLEIQARYAKSGIFMGDFFALPSTCRTLLS